ncbi:MAG: hypothetical protein K0R68_2755 [Mycobacterium sp.]|jgi:hypothetical protein|nr:hypothetical protein [Mycobacterium sp.]
MTTPRPYTDATDTTDPNLAYQNPGQDDQTRYPAAEFSDADRSVDPNSAQQFDSHAASADPGATRQFDQPSVPGDPAMNTTTPGTATQGTSATPGTGSHDRGQDGSSAGDALFGEQDLSELRARWNDVQAAFVDDPRACVQQADGLVSTAVEQLTANFSHTRSRLEEQWSRGEEASTEDLRVALKRYRDFFDRLLAV